MDLNELKYDFIEITRLWIKIAKEKYKTFGFDALTQIFMRGPFAGWSDGDVKKFIMDLDERDTKYPIHKTNDPYIVTFEINKILKYNPEYGNDKICKCGHTYYRHFDSMDLHEEMAAVGCKYCDCQEFELDYNKKL